MNRRIEGLTLIRGLLRNQRISPAVKAQFGPDSREFELVGGVRRSDRKKSVRKAESAGS